MSDSDSKEPVFSEVMSPEEKEHTLKQVEHALMNHDLNRASMMVSRLQAGSEDIDNTLKNLQNRIQKAKSSAETLETSFTEGVRALEHNELETAAENFREILAMAPDHAKARELLQTTTRQQDKRDQISLNLDQAHDARCRGDYETARELCQDILNISSDHESAMQFLKDLEEWISRRRQAQILVAQGDKLFRLKDYSKAIKIWESISDIDPSFNEGRELIKQAELALCEEENSHQAESMLRKAQQYLDSGRYPAVIEILESFPDDVPSKLDASIMLRKAKDGLETHKLMESLANEIVICIENGQFREANARFSMMLDIDSNAPIIADIQTRLNNAESGPA